MAATRARRDQGNLPEAMTTFVGRRQEVAQVRQLVSVGRLITLTGIGGVGKTRLAIEVARMLRRAFPDGVWLVELAELTDGALVAHTAADLLGVNERSGGSPGRALAGHLRDKRLFLVLDNCEHVIDDCAKLVEEVLRTAPEVRVLATSREPLGVPGEHIWPVPPLSLPEMGRPLPPGAYTQYTALALFAERAAAAAPGFTVTDANVATVAQICARLDGLPLAIELATARLRVLSPEELLERLEDQLKLLTAGVRTGQARHQTLRAAIEWSFDLCTEPERLLWARTSVFAGSFDLPAAEAICAADGIEQEELVEVLAALVDKSVLACDFATGHARYRLLETLRQFGRQKLRDSGAERVFQDRHRDWYTTVARRAEETWFGPHQADIFGRMRWNRPNLRAALEHCLDTPGETSSALYLAASLWFYWMPGGFLPEGRHWLERALAADTAPSRERVKALWVSARISVLQGDVHAAMPLLEECRTQAQQLGDESALAHALHVSGHIALLSDDLAVATVLLEEALARFQALDETSSVTIMSWVHLALAHTFQTNYDRAVALCREARVLCEAHGEQWTLSYALYALALAEWGRGETRRASELARDSLRLKRQFDDLIGIAIVVEVLAWVAAAEGESGRAARLLGASYRLWPSVGSLPLFGFKRLIEARAEAVDKARHALGGQRFDTAFEAGGKLGISELVEFALGEADRVAEEPAAGGAATVLTRREREVAGLIADGLSNKEIAERLVISQRTAEAHVEHALTKLGFTSRAQIAALISRERDSQDG
ncbi:ATP-binding protein [Saccharopolyspora taberi]|uniref:LuxR family transcriptional regulator n=1 Tax=Saccharopolyspora taberi TaxID=60895 RepID=A0ABN3VJ82_9PSEU